MTSLFYSEHYHRQHCTLQTFEQFIVGHVTFNYTLKTVRGTIGAQPCMTDDKYLIRSGLEHITSVFCSVVQHIWKYLEPTEHEKPIKSCRNSDAAYKMLTHNHTKA